MKILIVLVNIGEIGQATLKSALCGLFRMMILAQSYRASSLHVLTELGGLCPFEEISSATLNLHSHALSHINTSFVGKFLVFLHGQDF